MHARFVFLVVVAAMATPAAAQTCASPMPISCNTRFVEGNLCPALEVDYTCNANAYPGADDVWLFDSDPGQAFYVDVVNQSEAVPPVEVDLMMQTGGCGLAGVCEAQSINEGELVPEQIAFVGDGSAYNITVDDRGGTFGWCNYFYEIQVGCPLPCDPLTDVVDTLDCSTDLVGQTTSGGTDVLDYYSCPGANSVPLISMTRENIYAFTAQRNGDVTLILDNMSVDHDFYVLNNTCNTAGADCLAGSNDATFVTDSVTWTAIAGLTYYIAVEADTPGTYDLSFADNTGGCAEDCDDGIDNDGDLDTDCADSDCTDFYDCDPEFCDDGIDNDLDGLVDCADSDCDQDGDGVCDDDDVCPGFDDNADSDGDGIADGCDACATDPFDLDTDVDGVCDTDDICPGFDDLLDFDSDGVPDDCDVCPTDPLDVDTDGDGICDVDDLCQGFNDGDDTDGDGVADGCDNCPLDPNPSQIDSDLDGDADACDVCPNDALNLDTDGDTICDTDDPCPTDPLNPDADGDGVCDGDDICPGFNDLLDTDADGVPDGCDICPDDSDASQADLDGDGVGDACDPCPFDNPDDSDSDGVCDSDDICPGADDGDDADGDGHPDGCDICPTHADPGQEDLDGDGAGDACDPCPTDDPDDSDGDQVCDADDLCNGFDDNQDADGDGHPDGCDICPADFDLAQTDGDGDGQGDACDPCPLDAPDDTDADGVCDVDDLCPGFDDFADGDADGAADGCDNCLGSFNPQQTDGDGDGVGDVCDPCPLDNADDSDGDGSCDADDLCPEFDDNIDADGDGIPDFCDPCPEDPAPAGPDADADGYARLCDCDDNNSVANAGATEVCDGVDNDCNGVVDDPDLFQQYTSYTDADGDGEGDARFPLNSCSQPSGRVENNLDCNDDDPEISTAALDICDGIDNNCDGVVDDPICATRKEGCGCATPTGPSNLWLVGILALAGLRRRP